MKVVENSPQNARNCTIFKNFLWGGGKCPQTRVATACSFAARDMISRYLWLAIGVKNHCFTRKVKCFTRKVKCFTRKVKCFMRKANCFTRKTKRFTRKANRFTRKTKILLYFNTLFYA